MARIALLPSEFPPYHGGIGPHSRERAAAAGHSVTVLASDFGCDDAAEDAALTFRVVRGRPR